MAAKKTAGQTALEQAAVKTDEQLRNEILTGLIDKDARTYTMNRTVTYGGTAREGTFRFHYPTLSDRLRQGILQSQLLGGKAPELFDMVTYNIAYSMSFLMSLSSQTPAWFRFEDMESTEELMDMFQEVNEFINSFRKDDELASDAAGGENAAGKETVANS